jgi:hypothetical protein
MATHKNKVKNNRNTNSFVFLYKFLTTLFKDGSRNDEISSTKFCFGISSNPKLAAYDAFFLLSFTNFKK